MHQMPKRSELVAPFSEYRGDIRDLIEVPGIDMWEDICKVFKLFFENADNPMRPFLGDRFVVIIQDAIGSYDSVSSLAPSRFFESQLREYERINYCNSTGHSGEGRYFVRYLNAFNNVSDLFISKVSDLAKEQDYSLIIPEIKLLDILQYEHPGFHSERYEKIVRNMFPDPKDCAEFLNSVRGG